MVCRNQISLAVKLATVLLLLGGAAAAYLYARSDDFVRGRIVAAVEEMAPHWRLTLGQFRLVGSQAHLYEVTLSPAADGGPPAVVIPEVVVTLDREALTRDHAFVPEHVLIRRPAVRVVRDAAGRTNLHGLLPLPESAGFTPLCRVERASVLLEQAATGELPAQSVRLRDLDVTLRPMAMRHYAVRGEGRVEEVGDVRLSGEADLEHGRFNVAVAGRLRVDDELVQTACRCHPAVERKLAELSRPAFRVADAGGGVPVAGPPSLGLSADVDVEVRYAAKPGEEPAWSATAEILRGELDNANFRLPLRNMTGRVALTPRGVRVQNLTASNGNSGFTVDGIAGAGTVVVTPEGPSAAGTVLTITATEVALDGPLTAYLTPGLRKAHNLLRPRGLVDLKATVDTTGQDTAKVRVTELSVRDGSVFCTKLPYPVTGVAGTATQEGRDLLLDFTGRAGTRDVKVTGRVLDAGPGAGFDVTIEAEGVPIDAQLREAFNTDELRAVRAAADAMRAGGRVDGTVRVFRRPHAEPGTKPTFAVDVRVREGTVNYDGFPFPLEDVSARIRMAAEDNRFWHFTDLAGRNGPAEVRGGGTLDRRAGPAVLSLRFDADGVPIDRTLMTAATRSRPAMADVFRSLRPSGTLAVRGASVTHAKGSPPELVLPSMTLSDGQVELADFPYRWRDVAAEFAYADSRVTVGSLTARHGDTKLSVLPQTASVADGAAAEITASVVPQGDEAAWRVVMRGVRLRGVVLDNELLAALPPRASSALRPLGLRSAVDADFDLSVTSRVGRPLRLAARGDVTLPGNTLSPGLDLEGVAGTFRVASCEFEEDFALDGSLELDHVQVQDMHLTRIRGPVRVRGERVVLGSEAVLRPDRTPQVTRTADSITADFYGGRLGLDVAASPAPDGVLAYDLDCRLRGGDLNLWAADNGFAGNNLYGEVSGEVRLSGRGDDVRSIRGRDGFLRIDKARIFELPAMTQMISVLNFQPPDRSFRQAYVEFDLAEGVATCDEIVLYGPTLSFVGMGRLWYDARSFGKVDFDLFSYMPRNPTPILGQLMEAMTRNWIHVIVRGSVGYPQVIPQVGNPLFDVGRYSRLSEAARKIQQSRGGR